MSKRILMQSFWISEIGLLIQTVDTLIYCHFFRISNETISLCYKDKNDLAPKVILTGLKSGVGYTISITTIAGESCDQSSADSDDYITVSETSSPLVVYTSMMLS